MRLLLPQPTSADVPSRVHAAVVPTVVQEGLGRGPVEALLCGAVVLGYYCVARREDMPRTRKPHALEVVRRSQVALADVVDELLR